jgi:hypothetical protein
MSLVSFKTRAGARPLFGSPSTIMLLDSRANFDAPGRELLGSLRPGACFIWLCRLLPSRAFILRGAPFLVGLRAIPGGRWVWRQQRAQCFCEEVVLRGDRAALPGSWRPGNARAPQGKVHPRELMHGVVSLRVVKWGLDNPRGGCRVPAELRWSRYNVVHPLASEKKGRDRTSSVVVTKSSELISG